MRDRSQAAGGSFTVVGAVAAAVDDADGASNFSLHTVENHAFPTPRAAPHTNESRSSDRPSDRPRSPVRKPAATN